MDIYVQDIYIIFFLESILWENKWSRNDQNKLHFDAITTKFSPDPTSSSGMGYFYNYAKLGEEGWAFIFLHQFRGMSSSIQRKLENLRYHNIHHDLPLTLFGPTHLYNFWEQLFRILVGPFSWEKFIRALLVTKIKTSKPAASIRLKLISWFMTSVLCSLDFPHSSLAHSGHTPWGILDPGHCFLLRL